MVGFALLKICTVTLNISHMPWTAMPLHNVDPLEATVSMCASWEALVSAL